MEDKKSKKKVVIITLIVLILLALGIVGGYFGYKYWESNQTVGTEWGDTYCNYLQDEINQGKFAGATNGKMQFVQLEENQAPAMVLTFEKDNSKEVEVSVIDDNNVVKTKGYKGEGNTQVEFNLLYDIENQKYNWYEHEKKEDGTEMFTQVESKDIEENAEPTEDKKFEFKPDEMTEKEVQEGEIPSIPKFNEKFVEVEDNNKETDVDLNVDVKKKDFKNEMSDAVKNYEENNQTSTDKRKEQVEKKLEELETKKEEIKKAEEEAKRKAEEEAARKAAEEAAKGIKLGNDTIKYGTYKGEDGATGSKLVLNSDGTATLDGKSYNFSVGKYDFAQDSSGPSYKDAIILKNSDGTTYIGLYLFNGMLCNDPMTFVYSGN